MERTYKDLKEEDKAPIKLNDSAPIITNALHSLKEPNTLHKINSILSSNEVQIRNPTLRLDIEVQEDNTILELDKTDIEELFSKFGLVQSVHIDEQQKSTAIITMTDHISAYLAQQVLNEEYLPEIKAKVFVKWNTEKAAGVPSFQSNVINDDR